jgi:hypothetical protein
MVRIRITDTVGVSIRHGAGPLVRNCMRVPWSGGFVSRTQVSQTRFDVVESHVGSCVWRHGQQVADFVHQVCSLTQLSHLPCSA